MSGKIKSKQAVLIGAAALAACAALVVGIQKNVFVFEPKVAPIVDHASGEAYPAKPAEAKREEEAVFSAPIPEVENEFVPPSYVEKPKVEEEPLPPPEVQKPAPQEEEQAKPSEQPPPALFRLKPPKVAVAPLPAPQRVPSPPKVEAQPLPPPEPPVPKIARRAPSAAPTYFVNREVISNNIEMFPRWTGMLSRFNSEAHTLDDVCGPPQHTPCKLKEWRDFLLSVKDEPLLEKLRLVNRYMNKYPYIDDVVNWGFENYWETPYEFQRKSGNCKDYAIAKFMSLRAIGVPNEAMRIVVLKDLNLGGIIHAILVVSDDEKSYILDNQIKQVVTTDRVYHYVPIYSINEEHWWQHFVVE